jgi:hypothetical protein
MDRDQLTGPGTSAPTGRHRGGARGTSDGATTSQDTPAELNSRASQYPSGRPHNTPAADRDRGTG